jgi:hypothetical protein
LTQKHSVAGATFFMQSDALFEWKLNWTIVHLGVIFIYFLNILRLPCILSYNMFTNVFFYLKLHIKSKKFNYKFHRFKVFN